MGPAERTIARISRALSRVGGFSLLASALLISVEVVGRSTDYLAVTYRSSENRLRYNTFRWFTDPGGTAATFETSVYGRERDVEGLGDLLDKVSASVERLAAS